MACPNVADDEISMLKTARERSGAGYTSSFYIAPPIYMSDIQRLSGGNSSGSGRSYPSVSLANPIDNRPDGENPLSFAEFSSYNQNVTRTAFQFVFSSTSSSNACDFAIPSGTSYFHTDVNNLVPDAANTYYAYTTVSGTTPAPQGYYAIYSNDNFPTATGKYIYVNNETKNLENYNNLDYN